MERFLREQISLNFNHYNSSNEFNFLENQLSSCIKSVNTCCVTLLKAKHRLMRDVETQADCIRTSLVHFQHGKHLIVFTIRTHVCLQHCELYCVVRHILTSDIFINSG